MALAAAAYQHLYTSPWTPVQAALDAVSQGCIPDSREVNFVAWVCDGMHLLDEG